MSLDGAMDAGEEAGGMSPPAGADSPPSPPRSSPPDPWGAGPTAAVPAARQGKPSFPPPSHPLPPPAPPVGAVDRPSYRASPPPPPAPPPPPPSLADPSVNECRLVDYRGAKVAAFAIAGHTMLCLPQAFELFLKHLVGGLHTVYTKLKRLDITPLVCNVEQVRVLRGLGAIQPGVNRCKLLSARDFDVLYKDCTTASSRPGRPPKRATVLPLPIAAQDTLLKLKKVRMENGDYGQFDGGHRSPLLVNGFNHHHQPASLTPLQYMALNRHHQPAAAGNHPAFLSPGGAATGAALSSSHHRGYGGGPDQVASPPVLKGHHAFAPEPFSRSVSLWENCRAAYEDVLSQLNRIRESSNESDQTMAMDAKPAELSSQSDMTDHQSPVLNLSKNVDLREGSESDVGEESLQEADEDLSDIEEDTSRDNGEHLPIPDDPQILPRGAGGRADDLEDADVSMELKMDRNRLPYPGSQPPHAATPFVSFGSIDISSTEMLLHNIQGLLKVATDNARQQERQIKYERAELKMELVREKESREGVEKQLAEEQKLRNAFQRKLKREKSLRRRLAQQLEQECRIRRKYEEALRSTSAETLRMLNEKLELDRSAKVDVPSQEPEMKAPSVATAAVAVGANDNRMLFYKNPVLYTSAT